MVFQEVVEEGQYDLVIADESWDVDHYWHEHPELKRCALAWFTDFVGYLPMPQGGDREAYLTADYNAEMLEHIERYPRVRDRAIFVGDPDDIVGGTFGPGLPSIRSWTQQHFEFSGYITGIDPIDIADRAWLRHRFGYGDDEKVCIVTVGGALLRHFAYTSFRVKGRIFATAPPDGEHLHIFVADEDRETALVLAPGVIEKLWWDGKVRGLRVALPRAKMPLVAELLNKAWLRRAPKTLAATARGSLRP
jgi:hypothetical protein